MSSPDEDDIFIKLQEEDSKIVEELENVPEDYEKILEIMQRRYVLYRKYSQQAIDPVVMEIILTQGMMIKLEMGLLTTRHELQTDIANLTSRMDDNESKR